MTSPTPPTPALSRRLIEVLRRAAKELNFSSGTYARVLILSQGLAAGASAREVGTTHLLDAIQFCTLTDPSAGQRAPSEG